MYSKSDAACVECDTCRKLYTPKNFVCHTHKYESHTRHWGFDSANWRVYLKAVSSTHDKTSSSNSSSASSSSSVLSDIKISNKDNIAANAAVSKSTACSGAYNEEFELFKQKFLSRSQSPTPSSHNSSSSSSSSSINTTTPPSNTSNGSSSSSSSSKRKSLSDMETTAAAAAESSINESSTSSNVTNTSTSSTTSLTAGSRQLPVPQAAASTYSLLGKTREHSAGSIENLNMEQRAPIILHPHHQYLASAHPHPHQQQQQQQQQSNSNSNTINSNLIHINKKLNSLHSSQQHLQHSTSNGHNAGMSLNDLNNHLMSSQTKAMMLSGGQQLQQQQQQNDMKSLPSPLLGNGDSIKNSNNKSNGEHRLLNGLLSKPLNNNNTTNNNNNSSSANEFSNR